MPDLIVPKVTLFMLQYKVRAQNPVSHYLQIEATFTLNKIFNSIEVVIPSWRPGRYEGAEYAKNIRDFTIVDSKGNALPFQKAARNIWIVTPSDKTIIVKYSYFAFQADAGASYIDDDFWLLNPVNFLVFPEGFQNEECTLSVAFPDQWQVATTLTPREDGYSAKSYFELTDRPLLSAQDLTRLNYEVDGTVFSLCTYGDCPVDLQSLIPAFRDFSHSQKELFGSFPFREYYFLIVVLPFRFYHGVEHADNTVLVLGIDDGADTQKFIDDLLGVSSHELFHTWNIKKIRPKELLPYNLKNFVVFNTGMIAEGFTTYYGDLFLARSGVWSLDRYLEELNQFLKRHFRNPGRHYASLTTSSENLWLDGYKNGIPFHKVSIYVKGAIISLMLDFKIRHSSQNKHSLDDLLRWMDQTFSDTGYTLGEIQIKAEELAGGSLAEFFKKFVYGITPVEEELQGICQPFGLELVKVEPEHGLEKYLGFTTSLRDEIFVVEMTDRGSPAEKALSPGDHIIAINDFKPIEFLNEQIEASSRLELKIKRLGRLKTVVLEKDGKTYFPFYQLSIRRDATDSQDTALKKWVSGK